MIKQILKKQWDRIVQLSLYQKVFTAAFLLLLAILTINHNLNEKEKEQEIRNHRGVTVGTIIKHEHNGRSGTVTYYEYYVQDKKYVNTSGDNKRFKDCINFKTCIGLQYLVEYSKINPEESNIMWDKPVE